MLSFGGSRFLAWFGGRGNNQNVAFTAPVVPVIPEAFEISAFPGTFFFGMMADSAGCTVTSSSAWTVTSYPAGGWCNLSATVGESGTTIQVVVSKNLTGVERDTSFIVSLNSNPAYMQQVFVTQYEV